MKIGLNAHLLSNQPGYRSAGIHNVIHHLLLHLPDAAPDNWEFVAMVGGANPAQYPEEFLICQLNVVNAYFYDTAQQPPPSI